MRHIDQCVHNIYERTGIAVRILGPLGMWPPRWFDNRARNIVETSIVIAYLVGELDLTTGLRIGKFTVELESRHDVIRRLKK